MSRLKLQNYNTKTKLGIIVEGEELMGTNINMNIPFVKDLSEVTGDFWKAKVFANGQEHLLNEQNQNMMKF